MVSKQNRRIAFCFTAMLTCATAAHGQTFDPRPLAVPIAMPSNSLPSDAKEFVAWLDSSAMSLDSEGLTVAREHLFALISADAKRRFKDSGAPFPPGGDSTLAQLFTWADRLGSPGAALVAEALQHRTTTVEAPRTISPGITIGFDTLYTLVAEADGWMVRFPHYFMIGAATRQQAGNGFETTTAILSTLFARDSLGASQATILILSAAAPAPEFAAEWLSRLGLQPTDTSAVPIASAVRAYRAVDAETSMSRELVVLAPPGRTILAIFVGLLGTDDANRPHFVNLLETMRVRPGTN